MSPTKKAKTLAAMSMPVVGRITKICTMLSVVAGLGILIYDRISTKAAENAVIKSTVQENTKKIETLTGQVGEVNGKVDTLIDLQRARHVIRPMTIDPHAAGNVSPGNAQ